MYLLVSEKKEQLFAWVGRNFSPPAGEPKDQFALDAMKAFRKLHQPLFPSPPKLVTVQDGGANPVGARRVYSRQTAHTRASRFGTSLTA